MLILYTLTLFLSASLLFIVQPMFTRLVVPLLGGSPAVWNTGQAFFQVALLGGYAYAHFASRKLTSRWQIGLHLVLALAPLALLMLPIHIPAGWTPPTAENPLPWLLGLLILAVGLPFFVLSATAPLLQRWFSRTGHPAAADPYFLYAASNAGSLLALLSYPTLVEPNLLLTQQGWVWTIGYVLLIGMIAACGIMLWRREENTETDLPISEEDDPSALETKNAEVTPRRRIRWVLLAIAPVSLMLSIVTYISTDIAAIPLLWVLPLAIYLLTFVFVFARKSPIPHSWMVAIAPVIVLVLIWIIVAKSGAIALLSVPVQLLALFVIGMVCHGELAKDRPHTSALTEFYLWISVGGVLGGVFNALIAPLIFTNVAEYPITLVLIGLLLPTPAQRSDSRPTSRKLQEARAKAGLNAPKKSPWLTDLALPALLFVLTAGLVLAIQPPVAKATIGHITLMFGIPAVVCFFFRRNPLRFGLGVGAILLAGALFINEGGQILYAERSFFGLHRVFLVQNKTHHFLMHGNTLHGAQSLDPAWSKVPLTYYYPTGPLGQIFSTRKDDETQRKVAVVGLGSGSVACYAQPGGVKLPGQAEPNAENPAPSGENWTFYEIDPTVARIARDPRYFTFLQDCAPASKVVLGDGRLSLVSVPDGEYNLIVLDAFSSDAIPVHLLTREAIRLYLDKLAPGGILAFHISSRHFNLAPVLGDLAQDAQLISKVWADADVKPEDGAQAKMGSQWVVLARTSADLGELASDPDWVSPQLQPGTRVWTDDFSSLLSVLK